METKKTNGKDAAKPAKSSNAALWWILGGCLALLLVGGLVIGGLAWWGYKKVKKEIKSNQPNLEKFQSELEKAHQQAEQTGPLGQAAPPFVSSDENYSEDPTPTGFEAASGDTAPYPGERQIGYVKKVYTKSGKNYLDIDYIQWFSGDAAEQAMRQDGECPKAGECLVLDDYYIRNVNPLIRTFEITSGAEIIMQTYDAENTGIVNNNQPITFAQFKNIFAAGSSTHLKDVPYIVEIANKKIVKITEQYVP